MPPVPSIGHCAIMNGLTSDDEAAGLPIALLSNRPSSHPFNERRLALAAPAKIGRAVAKSKPTDDNAIFDCKVLSRNHATLWYEDGKFYLQDTRSSNGTFVNSQRLSNANEESAPKEVYSNDVVQFGVDVIENSRRVTHGCIMASLRLFHADGSEACRDMNDNYTSAQLQQFEMSGSSSTHNLASVSQLNLYTLAQCLKEALDREQALETKMLTLQAVLDHTQQQACSGWTSMVEEDRLLTRIESLQDKLEKLINSSSGKPEEELVNALRNELMKMHDERETYEINAKESLWRATQQSLLNAQRLGELEVLLKSADDERIRCNEDNELKSTEIINLAEKLDKHNEELVDCKEKLANAESCAENTEDDYKQYRLSMEKQTSMFASREEEFKAKIGELEMRNSDLLLQSEELAKRLETIRSKERESLASSDGESDQRTVELPISSMDDETVVALNKQLEAKESEKQLLGDKVQELLKQLEDKEQRILSIEACLENAESDYKQHRAAMEKQINIFTAKEAELARTIGDLELRNSDLQTQTQELTSKLDMSLHASRSSSEQMQQLLKQIEAAAMERAATSEAMQALASQLEIKAQRIVTLEAMLANDVKNDSNSLPLPGNCSMSEVDSFSSRASSEERGPLGALEDLADTSSLYTSSVLSASNALESLMSVLIGCYVFYYFVYNE